MAKKTSEKIKDAIMYTLNSIASPGMFYIPSDVEIMHEAAHYKFFPSEDKKQ